MLMNKLNVWLKNVSQQNKQCNTPPSKQAFIKPFYQMDYYNRLDEKILKTFIQRKILPTDPNQN